MTPKDLTTEIYSLLDELQNSLMNKYLVFATLQGIDEGTDDLYDCPMSITLNRQEGYTKYYILRILGGTAYGLEVEDYIEQEFLLSELDSDCLLQIGSRIS